MITIQRTACGGDTHIFSVIEADGTNREIVHLYDDRTARLLDDARLADLSHEELLTLIRRLLERDAIDDLHYSDSW